MQEIDMRFALLQSSGDPMQVDLMCRGMLSLDVSGSVPSISLNTANQPNHFE